MPAITAASAKLAYDKAANSLKRACNSLERYLPPSQDAAEEIQLAPPLVPRRRVDSVAGCALCVSELMDLEPGDRTNHQCTHQNQPPPLDLQREVDTESTAGSDTGKVSQSQTTKFRGRQGAHCTIGHQHGQVL